MECAANGPSWLRCSAGAGEEKSAREVQSISANDATKGDCLAPEGGFYQRFSPLTRRSSALRITFQSDLTAGGARRWQRHSR